MYIFCDKTEKCIKNKPYKSIKRSCLIIPNPHRYTDSASSNVAPISIILPSAKLISKHLKRHTVIITMSLLQAYLRHLPILWDALMHYKRFRFLFGTYFDHRSICIRGFFLIIGNIANYFC